jgi:hypothetical protein
LGAAEDYENINTKVEQTTKGLEAWNKQLENARATMQNIFKLMGQEKITRTAITKSMSDAHAAQLDTAQNIQTASDALRSTGRSDLGGKADALDGISKILSDPKATAAEAKAALGEIKTVFDEIAKIQTSMMEGLSAKRAGGLAGGIGMLFSLDAFADVKKSIGALKVMKDALDFAQEAVTALAKAEEDTANLDNVISKMESIETNATSAGAALHEAARVGIEDYKTFREILADVDWYLNNINNNLSGTETGINNAQPKAQGGPIYAAMGQFVPRGTDTVPAMLTPGEFVMNKASTQRLMQQLVPMNSGQYSAQYTQPGNSVQFGDMNITVNGGGTPKQTAVEIGNALRREIRRGRVTL